MEPTDLPLKILIVDDELLALDRLKRISQRLGGVVVVGVATSGPQALEQIDAHAPDVVLLDITMPGMSGLETGRRIKQREHPPAIIFTTAHEEFAIDAFTLEAVHYLLKPVRREALIEALVRARARLSPSVEKPAAPCREIWVSRGYELYRLDLSTVNFIEAEGDYMRFHADERSYLHYITIRQLEAELDPTRFIRVHRSFIVASDRVRTLSTREHGRWVLTLDGGQSIPVSATYLERVRSLASRT